MYYYGCFYHFNFFLSVNNEFLCFNAYVYVSITLYVKEKKTYLEGISRVSLEPNIFCFNNIMFCHILFLIGDSFITPITLLLLRIL